MSEQSGAAWGRKDNMTSAALDYAATSMLHNVRWNRPPRRFSALVKNCLRPGLTSGRACEVATVPGDFVVEPGP